MTRRTARKAEDDAIGLRNQAEQRVRKLRRRITARAPNADLNTIIHELEVSQVELEIQNEELRRIQLELAESRSRFADLYEFAPAGYLTLDERGVVKQANLRACDILGVERSRLSGSYLWSHIPTVRSAFREGPPSEEPQVVEVVLRRPKGEEVVIRLESTVRFVENHTDKGLARRAEWRVILSDISAQRKAERTAREREVRLLRVLEGVADGVISIDGDGKIESFNPAAERLFGYRAAEVVGADVGILMPAPHRYKHRQNIFRYLETGEARIIGTRRQVEAQRKDGSIFPIDLAVSALHDGTPHFVGIVRDVSERQRVQQAIAEGATAVQEAISRDLHDGVAQLVTGIELTAAALSEALSSDQSPRTGTAVRLHEQARSAQKEIRGLIKGVYRHAVPSGGLETALRELAKELEPTYGIRGIFQRRGRTKADSTQVATQLHYIAREAVFNAVKHAGANVVTIRLEGDDERLEMSIQDDGSGLQRAKAKAVGLGMEIMRYRANLIGGTLEIKSTKRGVTVKCSVERGRG